MVELTVRAWPLFEWELRSGSVSAGSGSAPQSTKVRWRRSATIPPTIAHVVSPSSSPAIVVQSASRSRHRRRQHTTDRTGQCLATRFGGPLPRTWIARRAPSRALVGRFLIASAVSLFRNVAKSTCSRSRCPEGDGEAADERSMRPRSRSLPRCRRGGRASPRSGAAVLRRLIEIPANRPRSAARASPRRCRRPPLKSRPTPPARGASELLEQSPRALAVARRESSA